MDSEEGEAESRAALQQPHTPRARGRQGEDDTDAAWVCRHREWTNQRDNSEFQHLASEQNEHPNPESPLAEGTQDHANPTEGTGPQRQRTSNSTDPPARDEAWPACHRRDSGEPRCTERQRAGDRAAQRNTPVVGQTLHEGPIRSRAQHATMEVSLQESSCRIERVEVGKHNLFRCLIQHARHAIATGHDRDGFSRVEDMTVTEVRQHVRDNMMLEYNEGG